MATARPGWSRRAQYGLFFSFLAVIAGIVIGLVLLDAVAGRAATPSSAFAGVALDVTGPDHRRLARSDRDSQRPLQRRRQLLGCGQPERQAQARARRDASADGRGQGDLPGKPPAQGDAPAARARARRPSRSAGSSAPHSTARAASPSSPPGRATGSGSECRCARRTAWWGASSTLERWPRACCSSRTAQTSSRRACFAAASR